MLVQAIMYEPDFFTTNTFIFSQQEVSPASNPYAVYLGEIGYSVIKSTPLTTPSAASLAYVPVAVFRAETPNTNSSADIVSKSATQIRSKFRSRTFASAPSYAYSDAITVGGSFSTTLDIEALIDNVVVTATVGTLNLSDTRVNHKPVAPLVV